MSTAVEDILGLDLSAVETTRPVVAKGSYLATITDVKTAPMKEESRGSNLLVTYKLEVGAQSTDPTVPINPGFTLTQRIALLIDPQTEGEERSKSISMQTLARIKEATGFPKEGGFAPLDRYVGKPVMISVSVRKAEGQFAESNDVGGPYKVR